MTSTRKRASTNGRAQPNIAQQLRARGTTVDLGGSPVKVVLDWSAVEELETGWGSLKAWVTELQSGQDGRMFRCVGAGIAACVRDLPVDPRSLMDLSRLKEYAEALLAALVESGLWQEDAEGNAEGATMPPSPGSDSSTTTSSAGTSPSPSSGA